jgi:hypothetical protein
MDLYIKVITVRAGTSRPVDTRLEPCPPGVEPANVQSYLTQKYGKLLRLVWTSTSRHPRVDIGWVFPGSPAAGTDTEHEILCIPTLLADDGTPQHMFEVQANQRQDFEELAASGSFDSRQVITVPPRDYQPTAEAAESASDSHAPRASNPSDWPDQLHQTLTQIARDTGATLHSYPRPGPAVRRVLLRDTRDSRGTQFEAAHIEPDGTLRIIGHDQGPGVTEFFGTGITSYEWIYTVPPDRVASLTALAGGQPGDDPLDTLAAYYHPSGGHISDLLADPQVAADFSNWAS